MLYSRCDIFAAKGVMEMAIISVSNFKGGVGKTTLCGLLGLEMAAKGYSVLFIDTDPQANLTETLAYGSRMQEGIRSILTKKVLLDDLIVGIPEIKNLFIIPSTDILLAVEESYAFADKPYDYLSKLIAKSAIMNDFDYIILDYAPSVSYMFVSGLLASTHIIVPLDPSMHSWQGIVGFNELMNHYGIAGKQLKFLASMINRTVTEDMDMAKRITTRNDAFKAIIPRLKVYPRAFFARQAVSTFAPERRKERQRGFPTAIEEWESFIQEFEEWTK